jgi:hypothetical protein
MLVIYTNLWVCVEVCKMPDLHSATEYCYIILWNKSVFDFNCIMNFCFMKWVETLLLPGFLEPSSTTVMGHGAEYVLLDWSSDVTLENLTINAHSVQIALSVRNGKVRLRNCRILGSSTNGTGILVLKGGCLEAQSCDFVYFGIGLVLDHAAQVSLEDCTITSCNTGIKVIICGSLFNSYSTDF